jgi:Zn-dependent protease with chaperone function
VDFYARQEAARRTTRWLLLAFLVSVALVVAAVDAIVVVMLRASDPQASPTGPVVLTTVVVLAIICGASLFKTLSLRSGGGGVARSLGGARIERNTRDPALRRLHNVVEEMAIASGVTMPEVYVLENEDGINAFAAGNSPADAVIAVTRGAATLLTRDELQGVVAHEFSHILNGDMRLNLRLLGWIFGLLVIAIVARIVLQSSPRASSRDRRDGAGALMLAALAVMVLGYIGVFFGRLLQAAVARHRERLADASAVQFTRNPLGLSGALLKIAGVSSGSRLNKPEAEEVAHMLFAAGLPRLFATHPSLEERLKALDPAFRAAELPALAAAAARDAQRLRQSDSAQAASPSRSTAAAGPSTHSAPLSALASDAAVIAGQAGTIATEQVRYAEQARTAIPEGVREFVDSADHARALTLALLASRNPQVLAAQREILEQAYGADFATHVLAQRGIAESLAPELRLPAVQQLFPSLRRLTLAERQKLRDVVGQLALTDSRIDVFECCLTLLLASSLYDELETGAQHGSASLLQEVDAIHVLFCVLAAQGTRDPAQAARAYEAGISVVLSQHRPAFRAIDGWPTALKDALARLVHLRPFAKKVLIEGMVRCIAHDRTLSIPEGELLRTVCAVLHCPLPPILGQAGLGQAGPGQAGPGPAGGAGS